MIPWFLLVWIDASPLHTGSFTRVANLMGYLYVAGRRDGYYMKKRWRHLFLNQCLHAFKPKRENFPRILRPWKPDVVDVLIIEPFHFNNII